MGILSYFGKQTYTLYVAYHSGLFVDQDDSELWFRLDYKYMDIHENSYQGFGKDFADLPRIRDRPSRELIKTSSDLLSLSQIADEFNEIQANDLYHRVSKKIKKGNLSDSDSDHPFPIRYRDSNNVLDYPEDYLDESKWDDWYGY
jgi:hypothetical protein